MHPSILFYRFSSREKILFSGTRMKPLSILMHRESIYSIQKSYQTTFSRFHKVTLNYRIHRILSAIQPD